MIYMCVTFPVSSQTNEMDAKATPCCRAINVGDALIFSTENSLFSHFGTMTLRMKVSTSGPCSVRRMEIVLPPPSAHRLTSAAN